MGLPTQDETKEPISLSMVSWNVIANQFGGNTPLRCAEYRWQLW